MTSVSPPLVIDTHCHLDHPNAPRTAAETVARAREAGVVAMVNIESGPTLDDNQQTVATARAHERVYAAVGVHPHDASVVTADVVEAICALAEDPKVVALGEAGLDYYYEHQPKHVQKEAFARWIAAAREQDLPLVVHTRLAEADTLDVFDAEPVGAASAVIHCFTGSLDFARKVLDRGMMISIPGVVTFKKPGDLPEVCRYVPADRLMVETDSPYLAPAPFRGKPNEPAFVQHTLACVAALRGEDPQDLGRVVTANAAKLFGLSLPELSTDPAPPGDKS